MSGKSFFVVLMFVLFGIIVAGGALGETDLTPDNGTTTTTSGAALDYAVFGDSSAGGSAANGLAITGGISNGPCGSVYTVRSGDTLSKIARACGTTVDDLVAFNPDIVCPDLIYPDQKINIVILPTMLEATAVPANVAPAATATTEPQAEVPAAEDPDSPAEDEDTRTDDAVESGLLPGESVPVHVDGFEAFTLVQVGIGQVGEDPQIVSEGITEEDGSFSIDVDIPLSANPGERWVVTITTLREPPFSVLSPEFTIAQ